MLCKKCGAEIANTSKFCGYCGEIVDVNNNQSLNVENNVVEDTVKEFDLGETIKIEPIDQESLSMNESLEIVQPEVSEVSEPVISVQPEVSEVSEPVISVQPEVSEVSEPVISNTENKKKSNKLIFIIGGVVLAIIAIVLVAFAMNNSSNSISVLKRAMANLGETGKNSATAVAKLNIEADGQSLEFSATAKVEKKLEDKYDIQLTVDKTLFTEEMNVYASINKEEATAYIESTTIDLLGMTSSATPSWLYYTLKLDEVMGEIELEKNTESQLKLEDIVDSDHFVLIDKVDNINHYQLIIDQELVNNIKVKAEEIADNDLKESLSDMEELEKAIKVDFYITTANELTKIELDMSEYLTEDDSFSKLAISIELKDLNNTKVEIPNDALKATTDVETYMMQNIIEPTIECAPGVNCEVGNDTSLEYNVGM